MSFQIENYNLVELRQEQLENTEGGKFLEEALMLIGAVYAAGYALGEFAYNITH
ncbi:hypothetical protein PQ465_00420 [Sphingobacterium oryzagri]|uniref:Class IIb bacteriocin, lactobin A/cerein 7B family n=1 Tax=Sphingobacterium oryzagri TaxID=3025669 RepID=A0ABY7WGU5_9SPHI|nr:hypothetical protein [Sphingobacterium sp. KACC 22765]WDF68857.1 hypothetical protein PQ465_00420 [Sphingobacterium sp. KACC 22765]